MRFDRMAVGFLTPAIARTPGCYARGHGPLLTVKVDHP